MSAGNGASLQTGIGAQTTSVSCMVADAHAHKRQEKFSIASGEGAAIVQGTDLNGTYAVSLA